MGTRDERIDVLKGIGIICVIWAHLRGYFDVEIYIFHMPLFFFLSGMFFRRKKGFVLSRFRSLIIPFVLYTLAFAGIFYLQGGNWLKPLHRISLWFPSAIVGPAWFLIALFNISFIYYLLDCFIKKDWLLLATAFAIGLVFYYWNIELPLDLRQSMYAMPFYALGRYLRQHGATNFTRNWKPLTASALMFAIAVAYCRLEHFRFDVLCKSLPANPLLFYGGALSAIVLLLNVRFFARKNKVNAVLSSFGRHSLAIMAIHMPYMFFLRRQIFHQHWFHDMTTNTVATFFITFILITAASYLLSVIIDHSSKYFRQELTKESSRLMHRLGGAHRNKPKG